MFVLFFSFTGNHASDYRANGNGKKFLGF